MCYKEREIISLNFALSTSTCTVVKMPEARLLSNTEDASEASSGCHDSETPSSRLGDRRKPRVEVESYLNSTSRQTKESGESQIIDGEVYVRLRNGISMPLRA
jgi:hypothetical protein